MNLIKLRNRIRGFVFGSAVLYILKAFYNAKKKINYQRKSSVDFDLEYGKATIEVHRDLIVPMKNSNNLMIATAEQQAAPNL